MILDNSLEMHGYATILIADYHGEYPLPEDSQTKAVTHTLWDPFNVGMACEQLNGVEPDMDDITTKLFGSLTQRYGNHWEPGMTLYTIRGSVSQLSSVHALFAQLLMGGPLGADDDTYDYWPNAFDMLMEMSADLLRLGYDYPEFLIARVDRVVKSAVALTGPTTEWEASDQLDNAIASLESIAKEVDNV